jgi:hypothetical protein
MNRKWLYGLLALAMIAVLVPLASAPSALAQPPDPVYLYGYIGRLEQDWDTLFLVDPHQPEAGAHAIPLPIPEGQGFIAAEISPTGEWLYLLTSSSEGRLLQLFNPETLETRDVYTSSVPVQYRDFSPSPIPVWSPDGQSLAFLAFDTNWDAFSAYHYSLASGETTMIYHGRRSGEGGEVLDDLHKLIWRPDSAALALYERNCIDMATSRDCSYQFAVASVPDGTIITRSSIEFESYEISNVTWSPDGQRLSFNYRIGDPYSGAGFIDVLVWEPASDTLTQATHFTNPLPIEPHVAMNTFLNRYYVTWVDTGRLLVSHYIEGFDFNFDYMADSFDLQTDIITLSNNTTLPVLSEFIEEWAPNPVTSEVAYMSTLQLLNAESLPRFSSRTVQLGTFNGQSFDDLTIVPDGYDLTWSPDGQILAYFLNYEDDYSSEFANGLVFVNQADGSVQITHPEGTLDSLVSAGWVAFTDPPTG